MFLATLMELFFFFSKKNYIAFTVVYIWLFKWLKTVCNQSHIYVESLLNARHIVSLDFVAVLTLKKTYFILNSQETESTHSLFS